MKRSIVLFLISICAIISFSSPSNLNYNKIIGFYKSQKKTAVESIYYKLKGISGTVTGCELNLYVNNQFDYTSCGAVMSGSWLINEDKLYLKVEKGIYKNDSINRIKDVTKDIPKDFLMFKIKANKLIGIVTNSDGSKSLNKLVINH